MLTVTGPQAFRLAEAHRRLRADLAVLHTKTARLPIAPPYRLERVRGEVAELLDDVVLPLAAVEDELVDLVNLEHRQTRAVDGVSRTEHDVVRELAGVLRAPQDRVDARRAGDRVAGALRAVDDLLPAHLEGEEQAMLTELASLGPERHEHLRDLVDLLPPVASGGAPLARFHLPISYPHSSELLRSSHLLSQLLPEGLAIPFGPPADRIDRRWVVIPVAFVVAVDELALRFTLDRVSGSSRHTVAWIDGRLWSCVDGRSSVLELRGTPPVQLPAVAPPPSGVRRAATLLGRALAHELVHHPCGASRVRPCTSSVHVVHQDPEGRP